MEVGNSSGIVPVYDPQACDLDEGRAVEALKSASQVPIPDPDRWLTEDLERSVLTAKLDAVLNWGRRWSCWPMQFPEAGRPPHHFRDSHLEDGGGGQHDLPADG
jgi:hypothetical protein